MSLVMLTLMSECCYSTMSWGLSPLFQGRGVGMRARRLLSAPRRTVRLRSALLVPCSHVGGDDGFCIVGIFEKEREKESKFLNVLALTGTRVSETEGKRCVGKVVAVSTTSSFCYRCGQTTTDVVYRSKIFGSNKLTSNEPHLTQLL